jgi:hypothetical protein
MHSPKVTLLYFTLLLAVRTASVVQWSEFLATDPEVRVRLPVLSDFLNEVGLERGPLNLVSTLEELFGRKISCSGLESRDYGGRDPSR